MIQCIMEIREIDKVILKFNNSSHSRLSFLFSPQGVAMDFSMFPEYIHAPLSSWLVVNLSSFLRPLSSTSRRAQH